MFNRTILDLKTSVYGVFLLLLIGAGAMVILLTLAMDWKLKSLIISLCLLGFLLVLRDMNKINKLWCPHESEDWQIQDKYGQVWTARLCDDSVCTLYFALLNFKSANRKRRHSVMIFPDSLNATSFRRLRVFLKN